MGWLTMTRAGMGAHATAKAYLDAQLTYERESDAETVSGLRVLKSAIVNHVYYAAAEPYARRGETETREAPFAIVCLTRWNPRAADGHVFGYKDMDESCGPNEANCPESILALLGPTTHEFALDWRRRCLAVLERRKRQVKHGDKVKLAGTMRFTDGYEGDEFTICRAGNRITLIAPGGGRYRISRFRERDWTIIPQTRIHAPIFAPRS